MPLSLSQELRQSRWTEVKTSDWQTVRLYQLSFLPLLEEWNTCEPFGLTGELKAGRKGKDFFVCVMHIFSGT